MEITYCRILDVPEKTGRSREMVFRKMEHSERSLRGEIEEALKGIAPVPQWYLALDHDRIVGGLGVIPNDFHPERTSPQCLCGVYRGGQRNKGSRAAFGTGVRGYGEKGNHNAVPSYGSHFLL